MALKRRLKPERHLNQLRLRPDDKLVSAMRATNIRRVLTDTTVYIHEWGGKLPREAADLIDSALRFHSSLCVSEIMSGLGNYHPDSTDYEAAWQHYGTVFSDIPRGRLLTADPETLAQAGIIAGILARTQGYAKPQRKALLNDAIIYLTAAKYGIPLLTANKRDCDLIQQVAGVGSFIHYTALL